MDAITFVTNYADLVSKIEQVVKPEFYPVIREMYKIDPHDLCRPDSYVNHGTEWQLFKEIATRMKTNKSICHYRQALNNKNVVIREADGLLITFAVCQSGPDVSQNMAISNANLIADACNGYSALQAENKSLREALQGLYDFTLSGKGYLDICLNDAEAALQPSSINPKTNENLISDEEA